MPNLINDDTPPGRIRCSCGENAIRFRFAAGTAKIREQTSASVLAIFDHQGAYPFDDPLGPSGEEKFACEDCKTEYTLKDIPRTP